MLQVLMCILVCVPKKGQGSVYRCHMHTCTHTYTHTKQWQLGSSYQGDRSMQLGPSASVMCLFTSVQKAWLLLSSQTEPPHHHHHHLHLYNPPPPPVLSFHNWSRGLSAFPKGLRWGNFFFRLSLLPPPPVCSGSQCTSSNIVPTSWQSCTICTPCQGSCCHGYWQALENKMSIPDSWGSVTLHLSFTPPPTPFLASPPPRPLLFSSKKPNTCEVVVLCACAPPSLSPLPLDAHGPEQYKVHACVEQQQ